MRRKEDKEDIVAIDYGDNNEKKTIGKYILYFLILLIIIIFILLFPKLLKNNKIKYYIELEGNSVIDIYKGEEYIEAGYIAYDNKNNDVTDQVRIVNTLDKDKEGSYEIAYILGTEIKIRTINVIKKEENYTKLYLKGNSVEYIELGEEYIEPGYVAINNELGDITSQVIATGTVDTNKIGVYKIVYQVTNASSIITSVSRTVIVTKSAINLTLNNNDYTNQNVIINVGIIDKSFYYLVLPNREIIKTKSYQYEVTENGTYNFIKYNTNNDMMMKSITISNIDREPPNGTCQAEVSTNTKITIHASDTSGIKYYQLNNKNYYQNSFTVDERLTNVQVRIIDNANNGKNITCTIKNIAPSSSSPKPSSSSKPSSSPKPSSSLPKPSSSSPKPSSSSPKPSSSSPKPSSSSPKPSSSTPPIINGIPVSQNGRFTPFVNGVQRALKTGECMKSSDNCFCPTVGSWGGFKLIMKTATGRDMVDSSYQDPSLTYVKITCHNGFVIQGTVNKNAKSNFESAFREVCNLIKNGDIQNKDFKNWGTTVKRTNGGRTICSLHAYGMAIDINADYAYTIGGRTYTPYIGGSSSFRKKEYQAFITALGGENKKENINYYLWTKVFSKYGFSWGGNWKNDFDPMHYEIKR